MRVLGNFFFSRINNKYTFIYSVPRIFDRIKMLYEIEYKSGV